MREKIVNSLPFCEYPLSAAILRALVTASARLTEPEWTGLILLRSMVPELLGLGREYGVAPGRGPACEIAEG